MDALMQYKKIRRKCRLVGVVLALLLLALLTGTVGLGTMEITWRDVWRILWAKLTQNPELLATIRPNVVAVVWELRLPRILCGALVGAGLATAGTVFQSILQNPLADPYTLGISSGAAFGAALAIVANLLLGIVLPIPLVALAFALITLLVVIAIARRGGGFERTNLIIAGIIVSAILSAGISMLKVLAGEDVAAIVYWLMGSLGATGWGDVVLVGSVVPVAFVLATLFANDLNVMTLGSRNAEALGVPVARVRLFYLILASAITAVCVSVCGIIGFVGLIVPHLLRFSLTSDNRVLIPLSALLGAALLSGADTVTRLLANGEIPVGVLTTLLGGPFFIYIFLRRKGGAHDA